jgi:hypothetical protein
MKTTLQKTVMSILLAAAIAMTGCDTEEPTKPLPEYPEAQKPEVEKPPVIVPPAEEPPAHNPPLGTLIRASVLAGTEWTLTGFINEKTGETTAPEPVADDACYRLSFKTDSRVIINTSGSIIYGSYCAETIREKIEFITRTCGPAVERTQDGELFHHVLGGDGMYAFILSEQALKIVCNDSVTLLLEPVPAEPVAASSPVGVRWQLYGFVDKETGEVRSPEPPESFIYRGYPFILWFKTDGSLVGRTSSNDMIGEYILDLSSSTIEIEVGIMTKVNELPSGDLFLDTLNPGIRRYEVSDGELRIFGDKDVDLLFKPY